MKKITVLLFVFVLYCFGLNAQTSIMVYSEDFESGGPGVLLNTTGVGTNSGDNQWVINNSYNGAPLYPNTTSESVTSGGTISFAPYSNYLHITDLPSGIPSCNYNPTVASDRFVQLTTGFCTQGMDSVKLTFFYLCQGSPTAYAEIYYSADGGPWTSTGAQYSNQSIWQYVTLYNPAFDNVANLRIGIRWVNNSGSLPGAMSFAMDDIFITGSFDNFYTNFNVIIDSITPDPICQNFNPTIYYHLTVPICGNGFFEFQLSNSTGSFASPTSLGIYMMSNSSMNVTFPWTTIPSLTPPGSCYKIRIHYYYTYYSLNFYSNATPCFTVQSCPNTITTNQPVVTMGAPDSLCVGSVIDIPFFSTGVFLNSNNYIAQLSDSNGLFIGNLNILGSSPDNNTYDPALGSPPGSVSGLVNENNQPIPDGCNYYVRVVSTNPVAIGTPWGPFCIKHCDIETNNKLDVHACLHSCAVGPDGFDTTIYVNTHMYNNPHNTDTSGIYNPLNNQFMLEVHSSQTFAVIPPLGGLGSVTADNDTTFHIHVPCADSLGYLGLQPGLYYLRIKATNVDHPWDVNGTIIRLLIGAPSDGLWIWQSPPDSVLCVGDAVYFYPIPYNAGPPMNSTYEWFLNGSLFSTDPAIGILFNGAGTFNLTVQETNYGCVGPVVPNSVSLQVLAPPTAGIIGPLQVCLGDTLYYHVTFHPNYYYEWSTTGGTVVDTSNNELYIIFDTEGVYTIDLLVLNKCGQAIGHKNILVTAHQDPTFTVVPSEICTGDSVIVTYTGTGTSPLTYAWNFDGGVGVPGGNSPGPHSVVWNTAGTHSVILDLSKYSCHSKDTNYVTVNQTPIPAFTVDTVCLGDPSIFTDNSTGGPTTWLWNFGDGSATSSQTNPNYTYPDSGSYNVQLVLSNANCTDSLTQIAVVNPLPSSEFTAVNPVCVGQSSIITYSGGAPQDAIYTWDFSGGAVISGSGAGPYEILWSNTGYHTVSLSITQGTCHSTITLDSVQVQGCELTIPNVITPNKDGQNDVFEIVGLESYPQSLLVIYNRWGKLLYKNNDYKNDWGGSDYSDGVYYYILTLKDKRSYHGTLTLIR